jgi:hypothetical protein
MLAKKIRTHQLEKCYAIAPLHYEGEDYILVAAEKRNKCLLFDLEGHLVDTIWDEPGGTMSMVQVPSSNGQFIATQEFYSPNDSKNAKLVLVTPISKGNWDVKVIAHLPFVHRFDIVEKDGVNYLLACTIKSEHNYKDDWTHPGKILVAVLPDDLSKVDEEHPLQFEVIKEGLTKNHGYCRVKKEGEDYSLIACEQGLYKLSLSDKCINDWKIEKLLDKPCSDAAVADFDQDGKDEIIVISPFHGDTIEIFKKIDGAYEVVYKYPKKAEFAHSIWAGELNGEACAIIGHRQGERNLIGFSYDQGYQYGYIEENVGSTNVFRYRNGAKECLVSTNREINEIAFYVFES